MELFLFLAALCAFSLLPSAAPVLLRCGLTACLRFSPRASLALSSLAALTSCASMLLCRGGLRAVPVRQRIPVFIPAFLGGTLGRMLLLMFTARFSGSLALLRLQAIPLFLLAVASVCPRRIPFPASRSGLFPFSLFCASVEGFFGCGGAVLFLFAGRRDLNRRRFSLPSAALLLSFIAQLSAILLTLLSDAYEIFPGRMLLALFAASALGGVIFEKTKKRAAIQHGLRIALLLYTLLSALSCAEQAFLPFSFN